METHAQGATPDRWKTHRVPLERTRSSVPSPASRAPFGDRTTRQWWRRGSPGPLSSSSRAGPGRALRTRAHGPTYRRGDPGNHPDHGRGRRTGHLRVKHLRGRLRSEPARPRPPRSPHPPRTPSSPAPHLPARTSGNAQRSSFGRGANARAVTTSKRSGRAQSSARPAHHLDRRETQPRPPPPRGRRCGVPSARSGSPARPLARWRSPARAGRPRSRDRRRDACGGTSGGDQRGVDQVPVPEPAHLPRADQAHGGRLRTPTARRTARSGRCDPRERAAASTAGSGGGGVSRETSAIRPGAPPRSDAAPRPRTPRTARRLRRRRARPCARRATSDGAQPAPPTP